MTDTMRVPAESHFTEGEPDLEPPEELAIAELDEQAMLEEELDNDDVDEQDVDDDVLQEALDDLVHAGDDPAAADAEEEGGTRAGVDALDVLGSASDLDEVDRALGARDHEDGLDVVLLERLALLGPASHGDATGDAPDADAATHAPAVLVIEADADTFDLVEVAPCGDGEFVCRSCFLVRTRSQLADATALTCRDCSL